MNRPTAVLGTVVFLFLGPGFSVVLIPWLISEWEADPSMFDVVSVKFAGILLITLGACVVVDSFARFALQGVGTPAPGTSTRHLVVTGLYRYVRNPLYLSSIAMVFGQALLFADPWLLLYGVGLWGFFHLMVVFNEERALRKAFGSQYERYAANVPRWRPQLRAWSPGP